MPASLGWDHIGRSQGATKPKRVIVGLGFRGVDADNPGVQIIHQGKLKSLTDQQRLQAPFFTDDILGLHEAIASPFCEGRSA
ncbi:MAG: hypothetical protein WBG44_08555 [Comamonas sp.]